MKTIKVFLASSEELEYERLKLDQAIRELNKNIYNKKDVNIDLFMWEMHDRQCRTEAKQEEYNKYVRESDMFLGLFWTKAGKFTLEEFDVAHKQFQDTQKAPALFVFFKEIELDKEDETLKTFKDKLLNNLSHYASNFCSVEKVKYEFLEEFLRLEIDGAFGGIKVVDGMVMYDDYKLCDISALPFAANNVDRTQLVESIDKLRARIKKLTDKAEDGDDWADIRAKMVEFEVKKKELERHDEALIRMSIDYARRASNESSATLLEAREAFRQGKMQRVRELTNVSDIDKRIEAKREYEKALNDDFELLLISRNAIIADISIPIEQRIAEVSEAYERLIVLLKELDKNKLLFAEIIFDYAKFAEKYAKYDKARELYLEHITLCEELYGTESNELATSYNNLGVVCKNQDDYLKALNYYLKALVIREEMLDNEHSDTALCYNNIGMMYQSQGEYTKALEYCKKALVIREKTLGREHSETASSYANIGMVYKNLGDYTKALDYCKKAFLIQKKIFGIWHTDTAVSCNNIGLVYADQGNYSKALEFYKNALVVREKLLGKEHPDTATSYNNIGLVYSTQGNYTKALEFYKMALVIWENVLGKEHSDTATCYNNIGFVYSTQGDYMKALEFYKKVLAIREKTFGKENPITAMSYNNIGYVYNRQGNYQKALNFYERAMVVREKVLGEEHSDTAVSYNNIGYVYSCHGDHTKALNLYKKALSIREKVLGKEHPNTAISYNNIGYEYSKQGNYTKSLDFYFKALEIWRKVLGAEHSYVITSYDNIGSVYSNHGYSTKALEYYNKVLVILKKLHGKKHIKTATCYYNIGYEYDSQGDYLKALECYEKAFDIFDELLGCKHPNTIEVLEDIDYIKRLMKKYVPKPIDTNGVVLPAEITPLVEALAEQVHEVWAEGRTADGWKYGEVRDDAKRETPCLVPYSELSEEEREYDRATALATLKFIVSQGFEITKK